MSLDTIAILRVLKKYIETSCFTAVGRYGCCDLPLNLETNTFTMSLVTINSIVNTMCSSVSDFLKIVDKAMNLFV